VGCARLPCGSCWGADYSRLGRVKVGHLARPGAKLRLVKQRELPLVGAQPVSMRLARFEDVPEILRLIERALEHGCRDHYDERQRRSVYLGYASTLFLEALGPFETWVATANGCLVGAAQVDAKVGLLRALFVDAGLQGQGLGRVLLTSVEARVRAAGCDFIFGAMSLNAVPFYQRAGFRARGKPESVHSIQAWLPVLWMDKRLRH
jgi:putative acetyltransferase